MIANNVLLKLKNPDRDVSEVASALLSMKEKINVLLDIQVEKTYVQRRVLNQKYRMSSIKHPKKTGQKLNFFDLFFAYFFIDGKLP